jgi:hypothetical protein
MSVALSGSVGLVKQGAVWRTGGAPGNKSADQQKVIELLASIPAAQGGMKEEWGALPVPGAAGFCPQFLGDAIYNFQSFWKANGTFHNIDGVVDPGGNTLRVLNTLANGGPATKAGPNGLIPGNIPDLTKTASGLRGLFPSASRWQLTNAPGVSAGFILSGSIGQLDVQEDPAAKNKERHLTYAAVGAGLSLETGPVTFTASTRDMRSISGMGRIYSRAGAGLTFEDLCGPMAIIGITGAAPNQFFNDMSEAVGVGKLPQGLSFTVFLLGMPSTTALGLTGSGVVTSLTTVADHAIAICMSAGECVGLDASAGVSFGVATGLFDTITQFDKLKQTKAADPYITQYEDAKKTVTDGIVNTLKDWSPF